MEACGGEEGTAVEAVVQEASARLSAKRGIRRLPNKREKRG